jgi:hypothetical protein
MKLFRLLNRLDPLVDQIQKKTLQLKLPVITKTNNADE